MRELSIDAEAEHLEEDWRRDQHHLPVDRQLRNTRQTECPRRVKKNGVNFQISSFGRFREDRSPRNRSRQRKTERRIHRRESGHPHAKAHERPA